MDVAWLMFVIAVLIFLSFIVDAIACIRNPNVCDDES